MIRDEDEHYLLDTNILSEFLKDNVDYNVVKKFAEHTSDMATSVITLNELLYGAELMEDGARKKALLEFIQKDVKEVFKIKVFSEKAAEFNAKIQAKTMKSGKKMPYDESQIAAIALAEEMILVTGHIKHFEPIAEHFPLKLENWFES